MDKPDTPEERPDPTKYVPGLSHLQLQDTRTEEEKQAASIRESARRKGRRSKWWETTAKEKAPR
ncbi:hypothetical protein [Stenotrophomonas sp. 278]|uniref:hypothetical protein n=1 Tax=Stenotrophomonas sp. 278 TaxID=2479851 RepID=UPI000F65B8DA|nr:hypothetical protein [Stenotrophomonas sp. 278]RRU05600.1 hypothetical protein EGJ34_18060 [Stenotrophomonas sp. 278]